MEAATLNNRGSKSPSEMMGFFMPCFYWDRTKSPLPNTSTGVNLNFLNSLNQSIKR